MRLEELRQLKKSNNLIDNRTSTFWLVAQCLNQDSAADYMVAFWRCLPAACVPEI
jgi:hypothetical protein